MLRSWILFPILLVALILGGLPVTASARDDRRGDNERQRRTEPAPDGSESAEQTPRERGDRKLKLRVEPSKQTESRDQKKAHKSGTQRTPRDIRQSDRERTHYPDRPAIPKQHQPEHRTAPRTERKPGPHNSHDRHYRTYRRLDRPDYRFHYSYRYHTHYLAPIPRIFRPIGFHLVIMPRGYVRIVVGGSPYFYYEGDYYRYYTGSYVVVRAPIGAAVHALPVGFIAFSLGAFTYYYVNDTYYLWDDDQEAYVVVNKPDGADKVIAKETEGRLYVYPKAGQSADQQADDRYACHRWAVKQSGVDPTEDDEPPGREDKNNYKRAITACLEGRGYTVK